MGRYNPGSGATMSEAGNAAEQIGEEHRSVRLLAKALGETTNIKDLADLLFELETELIPHFEAEEGPNGLEKAVREEAPRNLVQVGRLLEEHKLILKELEELTDHVKKVRRGAVHLGRRLMEHEAAENELLVDTLYTDIGAAD